MWIGISDVGTETEFAYLSDGALVNFVCEDSKAASGNYLDKTTQLLITYCPTHSLRLGTKKGQRRMFIV